MTPIPSLPDVFCSLDSAEAHQAALMAAQSQLGALMASRALLTFEQAFACCSFLSEVEIDFPGDSDGLTERCLFQLPEIAEPLDAFRLTGLFATLELHGHDLESLYAKHAAHRRNAELHRMLRPHLPAKDSFLRSIELCSQACGLLTTALDFLRALPAPPFYIHAPARLTRGPLAHLASCLDLSELCARMEAESLSAHSAEGSSGSAFAPRL